MTHDITIILVCYQFNNIILGQFTIIIPFALQTIKNRQPTSQSVNYFLNITSQINKVSNFDSFFCS